jgi:hydroxyacylglutathione hydrolase
MGMKQSISTIKVRMPLNVFDVNCYLIKSPNGFLLIDTAFSNYRSYLEKELAKAGCQPGDLKLIIITHSDIDHVGNAAYLRKKYAAPIAIHRLESATIENGDESQRRKKPSALVKFFNQVIVKTLLFLTRFGKYARFRADILIDDAFDLSQYGFDAKVVHIPGHSRGSIGVLTGNGDLFCGDILWNMRKPGAHGIIDDKQALTDSLMKMKALQVNMIYPGHGQPFKLADFLAARR